MEDYTSTGDNEKSHKLEHTYIRYDGLKTGDAQVGG